MEQVANGLVNYGGRFPSGYVDRDTARLFVIPRSVSPGLSHLSTVRLVDGGVAQTDGGANAFVEAVPVASNAPAGEVVTSTWDPAGRRYLAVVLAKDPTRYELVSLRLNDAGAQLDTFTSLSAPDPNGPGLSDLHGSGGQFSVVRGNTLLPLTLSGAQAQWGAPSSATVATAHPQLDDLARGRVLTVGDYRLGPDGGPQWVPAVRERAPLATSWTTIPFGGTPPDPRPALQAQALLAHDAQGDRLLTVGFRPVGPTMVHSLYEAKLASSQWSKLRDLYRSVPGDRLLATDPEHRVGFESAVPLSLVSLAPGRELDLLPFTLDGALATSAIAATMLRDGKALISTDWKELLVFDPAALRYSRLASSGLPAAISSGHTLVFDEAGNRALSFGGSPGAGAPSNEVYAISLDGALPALVNTVGAPPPPRTRHASLAVGREMVVVGGFGAANSALGDVWALQLDTLAWRRVGELAAPRAMAALLWRDSELWVIGGTGSLSASTGVASIEALDLASGASRAVTVEGSWPPRGGLFWTWAPLGAGVVAIDSGSSVDQSSSQLWELMVGDSQVSWRNSDPRVMDAALYGLVGVGGCDQAWFLGGTSWRLRRP